MGLWFAFNSLNIVFYLQHYEADVTDLELSFCCDEDCMGRLETHELVPGGRAIAVTAENR